MSDKSQCCERHYRKKRLNPEDFTPKRELLFMINTKGKSKEQIIKEIMKLIEARKLKPQGRTKQ